MHPKLTSSDVRIDDRRKFDAMSDDELQSEIDKLEKMRFACMSDDELQAEREQFEARVRSARPNGSFH